MIETSYPGGHVDWFRWKVLGLSSALNNGGLVDFPKSPMPLYLASLNYRSRDMKARIFRYLEHTELSSIKPRQDLCQAHSYCIATSGAGSLPDTEAGTCLRQPHEVPASTTHFYIEVSSADGSNGHPSLTELLLDKHYFRRQRATFAQEHRVLVHTCTTAVPPLGVAALHLSVEEQGSPAIDW